MLDRIGVGVICHRAGHGRLQRPLHLPEIGRVVSEPILLRLKIRPRRNDIHVLWRETLRFGQHIRIETKLKNRPRLRFAGELRVDRLIGPPAQCARHLDAAQNVGTSIPALVRQRGLHDYRHTALHGRECRVDGFIRDVNPVDPDDV